MSQKKTLFDPNRSLNVCFLKRYLGQFGGLEKYTKYLSQAFAERGHSVTFLCAASKNDLNLDERIQIERLNSNTLFPFQKLQSFDRSTRQWLSKNEADIIFGMDRTSQQTHIRAGNGVHKAYMARRKTIDSWLKRNTYFLNPTNKAILDIEKTAFENPELKTLFTNSQMVKDEIIQYYDVNPENIEVVHNGVEYDELSPYFENWEKTKQEMLDEMEIDPDIHLLLFIGNGYQRKGLTPLLHALSRTKERHFHLIVIGKERNLPQFRKEADQLGLKNHVSFLGAQPNILKYYALADTCVIPSFYDPFANVTLEAMAMGVFVITSLFNGGHEIVNPTNGSIIPSLYNIDEFAQLLSQRLKLRKTQESALKVRHSIQHLNFKNQLDKMIQLCLN